MEQPEFCYDEFGFRVDKEGKMEPLVCNPAALRGEDSGDSASCRCDLGSGGLICS